MCNQRTVGWVRVRASPYSACSTGFSKNTLLVPFPLLALILSVLFPQALLLLRGLLISFGGKSSLRQSPSGVPTQESAVSKMVLYFYCSLMPFSLSIIKAVMLKNTESLFLFNLVAYRRQPYFFFASYTLYPRQPFLVPLTPQPVT